jgi:hypothetical protein
MKTTISTIKSTQGIGQRHLRPEPQNQQRATSSWRSSHHACKFNGFNNRFSISRCFGQQCHDIGKLVLLQIFAEFDIDMADKAMDEDSRMELANVLSVNHGHFGAALLKKWGFSPLYQQIALLHDSLEKADPIPKELLMVHFANLLAKSIGYHLEETIETKVEDGLSTHLLQIDPAMIAAIGEKVQRQMAEYEAMF